MRVDSGEPDVRWEVSTGAPYVSSLVHADGLLFMATERGIASGNIDSAAGSGVAYVVDASRDFRLISQNDLGARTLASPAISDGALYLRTDERLAAVSGK